MDSGERFWLGHLNDSRGGSLVIWDRLAPRLPEGQVYLYHYKRDEILPFSTEIVRRKLRPLSPEEKTAIKDVAMKKYFDARSRLSIKLREEHPEWFSNKQCSDYDSSDQGIVCYECNGSGGGVLLCPVCVGRGVIF